MKSVFSLFTLVMICFTSCHKDVSPAKGPHCSVNPTKYISSEISNFKFKKGTYWVYVDSVSLVIDTMHLDTVFANGLYPYQYCPDNYHEFYSFSVNPKDIFSKADVYSLQEGSVMRNQRSEEGSGDGIYGDGMPELDSVFIYDRYYKSVVMFTKNSDPAEHGNKTIYYSNTTFGFLKKEVFNSINQLLSQKILKDKAIVR